jgi:hypothetical protein
MLLTRTGRTLTAAFAVFCAANAFGADTQLLNLVMPDAQLMAGVNVVNAEISPLGQFFMTRLSASSDQGLQAFVSQTGFDPRKDVTEVLAASSGNTSAPSGLLLAKGNFNVSQLLTALAGDTHHQVTNYGPATLITPTDAKANFALAFLGSSISIAGDVASVKAAIDRSSGANSISAALAAQVQTLSTTQDAWSVSIASLGALIPGGMGAASTQNPMGAQVLQIVKNIQSASSGVKFGANVVFTAQAVADTPQNASSLADVIKMVAGLAAMGAAGQGGEGAAIAQMVQAVQVSTDGTAVNLSATIPESQIEAIVNNPEVKKGAGGAKVRKM